MLKVISFIYRSVRLYSSYSLQCNEYVNQMQIGTVKLLSRKTTRGFLSAAMVKLILKLLPFCIYSPGE